MHTKDEMREWIKTALMQRLGTALLGLYARQTADEQMFESTNKVNQRGFNKFDAEILSSFAEQFKEREWLSEKQVEILREKLSKYAGQLAEIANEMEGMKMGKRTDEELKTAFRTAASTFIDRLREGDLAGDKESAFHDHVEEILRKQLNLSSDEEEIGEKEFDRINGVIAEMVSRGLARACIQFMNGFADQFIEEVESCKSTLLPKKNLVSDE